MSIANSIKDKGFYYIPDFITENKVNELLTSIKKLNKEIGIRQLYFMKVKDLFSMIFINLI